MDIIMFFDECLLFYEFYEYMKDFVERMICWVKRGKEVLKID